MLRPGVFKAQNKNRQYAPTGPDGQTAARFARRCGKRYVPSVSYFIIYTDDGKIE
jgi:hypothetical protein